MAENCLRSRGDIAVPRERPYECLLLVPGMHASMVTPIEPAEERGSKQCATATATVLRNEGLMVG